MERNFEIKRGISLIALAILCSCSQRPQNPYANLELRFESYANCTELETDIKERASVRRRLLASGGISIGSPEILPISTSAEPGYEITNNQENGVIEGDKLKRNSHQIYFARGGRIEVIDLETFAKLDSIDFGPATSIEVFADEVFLWALVSDDASTRLLQYRSEKLLQPTLERTWSWPGYLRHSRMKDGEMLLVLEDGINWEENTVILPASNSYLGVACDQTYRPSGGDFNSAVTKVISLDFSRETIQQKEMQYLGWSSDVYVSGENLYFVKDYRMTAPWTPDEWKEWDQVGFVQIPWRSGGENQLEPAASGVFPGHIKDRHSLKEYWDESRPILYAGTTLDNGQENRLIVLESLDGHLNLAHEIRGLGIGEEIKAMRYMNERAYMVTFENVDPLYNFDLTNKRKPLLLGELKVPGYSAYLHPLSEGRLLGIGYDVRSNGSALENAGIQISLFDTQGNSPELLDKVILGNRESYSSLFWDSHAFFLDKISGIFSFPMSEGFNQNGSIVSAVALRVVGDQLLDLARFRHEYFSDNACPDQSPEVDRVFRVDDSLLSVSAKGIQQHDLWEPDQVQREMSFCHLSR